MKIQLHVTELESHGYYSTITILVKRSLALVTCNYLNNFIAENSFGS